MNRPAILRNITHRILWVVTPIGTVGLSVHWLFFREPSAEWRILLLGLLLSIALGWWPLIATVVGILLAAASWISPPALALTPLQIPMEILAFTALGLGWGLLLHGLVKASASRSVLPPPKEAPTSPFGDVVTTRIPASRSRIGLSGGGNSSFASDASSISSSADSTPDEAIASPAAESPPPFAAPPPASAPIPHPVDSGRVADVPHAPVFPDPAPPPARPVPPSLPETSTGMGVFQMPTLQGGGLLPNRPQAATYQPPEEPPRQEAPKAEPPARSAIPMASPLMTQEVDLGEFRAFVAAQQTAAIPIPEESLPVNRVSGRSLKTAPPKAPPPPPGFDPASAPDSTGSNSDPGARRTSFSMRPETVSGAPYETILEWYNQFSWSPWKPEELEKRYFRHGQKVSWDVLALQDLVRAWKVWRSGPNPPSTPDGYTNLWELEGFLRCETLGMLRHQGHPDLNLLSREEPNESWMAVYRETRGRMRGGSPSLRQMQPELIAFDPDRALSGRPDALVEISGECDVVAFVTPMAPDESMTWSTVYAEAQHRLAERLGIVVTENPIVICLPMSHWDDRRHPRLQEVQDRATEGRRLDVALERFQRQHASTQPARAQTSAAVCNGCPGRHACPQYSGTRPRLDLANPPPLLQRFLQ